MLAMSSVFCTCFQNIVENICICVSIEIVFYTAMLKTFANIIEVKKNNNKRMPRIDSSETLANIKCSEKTNNFILSKLLSVSLVSHMTGYSSDFAMLYVMNCLIKSCSDIYIDSSITHIMIDIYLDVAEN